MATVSCLVLLGTGAVYAQDQLQANAQDQPPEEVLVTGSLIRGAPPVGLTVTTLSQQDFSTTGTITVSDLLRNSIPSVIVTDTSSAARPGNVARANPVNIHGLGYVETLVLIDGMRIPLQSTDQAFRDPSTIPSIALQRVDLFADGASATYGADAVAGVINLVLRRNYSGAMTQVHYNWADGMHQEQLDQLWGTTWATGGLTLSAEWYNKTPLYAVDRPTLYGSDLSRWGLGNLIGLIHSTPATIVTSTASNNPQQPIAFPAATAPICTNCFKVPAGQNGAQGTLVWPSSFAAGDNRLDNAKDPIVMIVPSQQRLGGTATIDQEIMPGINFFGTGFYSNRRGRYVDGTGGNGGGAYFELVKNNNPYYPVGGPAAGLNVYFDLMDQLPPTVTFSQHTEQGQGGFDLALPYEWHARLSAAISEDKEYTRTAGYNENNIRAALGQSVTATAIVNGVSQTQTLVKPANIPYLNVFCDWTKFTCNDPRTLSYLQGYFVRDVTGIVHQYEATTDGKIVTLPGGDLALAVGADYVTETYSFHSPRTDNTISAQQPNVLDVFQRRTWYAVYTELRVPIIGEANALPFAKRLEFSVAYRYDHYSDFGNTTNPEVRGDWEIIDGITLHGNWGTGFRAPTLNDISQASQSVNLATYKMGTSAAGDSHFSAAPGTTINGLTVIGSSGGLAGLGLDTRPAGYALQPETSRSVSAGATFSPPQIPGLTATATYYNTHISHFITQAGNAGSSLLNDPKYDAFIKYNPSPATVNAMLALPGLRALPTGGASTVQYIVDAAVINAGALRSDGIDYEIQYTTAIGDTGDWTVGLKGSEVFRYDQQLSSGTPWTSLLNTDVTAARFPSPLSRRIRMQLGWTDGTLSLNGFLNYRTSFQNSAFPGVIGAPAGYSRVASHTTIDLAIGYDLRDQPSNKYLRNIRFDFAVQNAFDRLAPLELRTGANLNPLFAASVDSPIGRLFSISVTKSW